MCQRRVESTWSILPDECVYYILNMCRWDWFKDDSGSMQARRRFERTKQKQQAFVLQLEQQAAASAQSVIGDCSMEDTKPSASGNRCARITRSRSRADHDDVLVQEEVASAEDESEEDDKMDDDDDEDYNEEDDDSDSDGQSDNGDQYHTADRRQFRFQVVDSDDEEGEVAWGGTAENQRRDWIRRQFGRIHVLRALASMEDRAVDVMEG
jgi:hypothetical protein